MCDEISILANFWMFVRSVAQYFVRIVVQYQYQAIIIYTRFSTKIDVSLFAFYRSLRTINHIFACLWKFKNSTSYFCLLVEVLSSFILDSRRKLISVCLLFDKPVCKYILLKIIVLYIYIVSESFVYKTGL